MAEKTLTLRLDRELAEEAEAYAARHATTLHELVVDYLRALVTAREPSPEETPILQRLTGILPSSVSEDSYRDDLAEASGE